METILALDETHWNQEITSGINVYQLLLNASHKDADTLRGLVWLPFPVLAGFTCPVKPRACTEFRARSRGPLALRLSRRAASARVTVGAHPFRRNNGQITGWKDMSRRARRRRVENPFARSRTAGGPARTSRRFPGFDCRGGLPGCRATGLSSRRLSTARQRKRRGGLRQKRDGTLAAEDVAHAPEGERRTCP